MKYFSFILIFLLCYLINVNAAVINNTSTLENSGFYTNCVTANFDQIYLTKEGIFVHIDRELLRVCAIDFKGNNEYECRLDFHESIHNLV